METFAWETAQTKRGLMTEISKLFPIHLFDDFHTRQRSRENDGAVTMFDLKDDQSDVITDK